MSCSRRRIVPVPPRPARYEPDPSKLTLFAVEERLADARRAIARARQLGEPRFRDRLVVLEDVVQILQHEILREARR